MELGDGSSASTSAQRKVALDATAEVLDDTESKDLAVKPTKDVLLHRIQAVEQLLEQTEAKIRARVKALAEENAKPAAQSHGLAALPNRIQPSSDTAITKQEVQRSELALITERVLQHNREKAAFAHALVKQHWRPEQTPRRAEENWILALRSAVSGEERNDNKRTASNLGSLETSSGMPMETFVEDSMVISIFHDLYRWHRRYCRALQTQYDALYAQWRQRLRQWDAQRQEREVEQARDRDRYLFLAARGLDTSALAQQRTSVLADLDTYLFEIEMDGGTAGGQSRWARNLAVIPDQEWLPCSTARNDGGSVRVLDPTAAYREAQIINPWTAWEQRVFIEKFLIYYKDFYTIASFLAFKTTADCVLFYFQNKLRLGLREAYRTYQRLRRANIPVQLFFTADSMPYLLWADHTVPLLTSLIPAGAPRTPGMGQRPLAVAASSGVVGVLSAFERPWSEDEVGQFFRALTQFGSNFRAISSFLGTRTARECAEFFRMNRRRLGLDRFLPLKELTTKAFHRAANESTGARSETDVDAQESLREERPGGGGTPVADVAVTRGTSGPVPSRGSSFAVWTPEEEIQFAEAFSELGADWRRLAELIPSKTPEQIYNYWQQQALSTIRQSRRGRSG
jgi:hypothetical protein